ncbi:two-component regulator propeller domain-containing protein [Pedobacter heparinus]|uniref:histidine kinase n=1 Tax=Pedobacter heparinus (strain ATCC 13125 / DSM 2366 / CIP 104194 / JCM 7457 / NBRC 12017 / NCIMB 9290 / NRRL B-14731 / HIM 762-3) TaxID=485917 RepID=C6XVX4_PEDHD|nr:two-component regulator propeller domain-containing protein [Pedobacter heparinus]ACU06199.1 response regulator receiver [Pedobacter heparinus DSM 2366]
MKGLFKFYFSVVLICFSKFSSAITGGDPVEFYFQQYDNRNGLSNSAVNIVFQDKDQLLWVGTWDGLNMYDGTDFRVFNYNSENQGRSIGNNVIQDIKEDRAGNIWISTIGGITRFEKPSGKFYRYFYNQATKRSIAEKEYELAVTEEGIVFCYSKTYGLSRFDFQSNQFKQIPFPGLKVKALKMESGRGGLMWFLKNDGTLLACKVTAAGLSPYRIIKLPSQVNNFFTANQRMLFTDTDNNLWTVDNGFQPKKIKNIAAVKSVIYYHSHYIVAFDGQGIGVYNDDFESSSFMQEEVKQLANTRVTTLEPAKDSVLWVGTDGNGLIKIYPKVNHFGLVNWTNFADLNKPVRAFAATDGNLWVGTKGKGIVILKDFNGSFAVQQLKEGLSTANGLDNNSVYALKRGRAPYIYIGTDGQGLGIYDLRAKKVIRWQELAGTAELPAFGSVYAILEDRDSSLWLGTSGNGLIHLKLTRNTSGMLSVSDFKQYLSGKQNGPANDIIYALSNGDDERLWIACRYGGLSVLDKRTGRFKTFKAFSYPNSLSNNDVLSLYKDSRKRLWIGTSYGLNMLSEEESVKDSPVFKKFTMNDGLPNNTIHAIEAANSGNIWVSTNKGLARLNPVDGAIASFRESDGLQSNEFSDGAVWKSASGKLYFGGIYGFNYFIPENITGNKLQPNLLVSGIQLGGKNLDENRLQVLNTVQAEIPEYTVPRKSNFFQLSLKPMSFLNEAKNEFAYKLDGLDKNWNYSGGVGNIVYNNVPPGNYTMRVRWSNGEGVWTDGVGVFKLQVEQYFWLSYPALFTYFIIVVASGYAFHLYRKNKLQMKYQLQMEHLLRQKDEAVHQQRLNFFTNIAHEIQTPLTMIMGSVEHYLRSKKSELLKNKENNYFISIVHQHTARLTYLVQQLLEFRKAEAGYLKRNDDYVDISKMLESLSELFVPASRKNSQQYLRTIQSGIAGFIDKDKFEKILFNLLSNAFKHSGPQETVVFKAGYHQEAELLEVSVSNSGCTLKQEHLEQIFNKFYVSNEQQTEKFSTGIGLAFTKELVTLMDADIKVSLQEGWIDFMVKVQLPTSEGKDAKVITSAPSSLYLSLVQEYEQPELVSAEEENKNSLIDELQAGKPSILLVEDEPELRYLIRNVLKEQYVVYEAGTGVEALAFLYKTLPDLIISDVMMPDMNGLELCRTVKQTPAMAQIPFVILSARGSEDNKAEGYELGADAYIPKPFQINYLLVRIRKLLDDQARMESLIKDQHITNQFMDADIAETDKKFLEGLLKVIENNLNEPELNAATLENALSISKMQLYRRLKSLAGMTPAEFIKRIRLKHAADMLIASQYTVSEIFYRTGFNNKSYFFREFKKIYRCAPNEYRQQQYAENTPSL